LKDGLETLGVLQAMTANASAFRMLFCKSAGPLTTMTVENLFVPQMSRPGSNRRSVENRVYAWWLDLLEDISG